ncbi:MAG TPA: cytochrome c [Pyrinomonadaceae bacterium]|nr:cytochrome c [Pyrinomonadaceae bacterium]
MKVYEIGLPFAMAFAVFSLSGCNLRLPGRPTEAERWRAPSEISDFSQLYKQNCAGCHGADGQRGATRPLNDSLYLAFVNDAAMKQIISEGQTGTNMPAFSQRAGGSLTDQQIDLLISGMRAAWARPDDFKGQKLPAYSVNQLAPEKDATANVSLSSGDTAKGTAVYQTYCARCHGADGAGGSAGSIVDPNFLAMVSDQGLRTTVVVGRADLGKPDWRSNLPGRPMTEQEIDDVVSWLVSHRPTTKANGAVATLR